MKYLKLYEEFTTDVKYSIVWQAPDDKLINLALIDTYIETYKFQDAKNRLQIFSTINLL